MTGLKRVVIQLFLCGATMVSHGYEELKRSPSDANEAIAVNDWNETRYIGFDGKECRGISIYRYRSSIRGHELRYSEFRKLKRMPDLVLLSTSVKDRQLKKLATLPIIELDLVNSELKGKGLSDLAGMESLKKLTIGGCTLSDTALASLAELDQVEKLVISADDYVKRADQYPLAEMEGLKEIGIYWGGLDGLTRRQRDQLAGSFSHLGLALKDGRSDEPVDLDKASVFPTYPARQYRYPISRLMQLEKIRLGIMALGFLSIIFPIVCVFIWRSQRPRCRKISAFIPRLSRIGFVLSLAGAFIVLGMMVKRQPYRSCTSAEYFWELVSVGQEADEERYWNLPPIISGYNHCFYVIAADAGHPWRGKSLCAAPTPDLVETLPAHLNDQLETCALSDAQLGALLEYPVVSTNRLDAIEEIKTKGAGSFQNHQALYAYLAAVESDRLLNENRKEDYWSREATFTEALQQRLLFERVALDWERRVDRRHLTIAFEVVFFTLLIFLYWLPFMFRRLNRYAYRFLAFIPMLAILPYQLGYCSMAGMVMMPSYQGYLYNLTSPLSIGLHRLPLVSWEWMEFPVWPILDWFNQPTFLRGLTLSQRVFSGGGLVYAALIWIIGWLLLRKLNRSKSGDLLPEEPGS